MQLFDNIASFLRRSLAMPSDRWPNMRGDYTVVDAGAAVVVASVAANALANELLTAAPAGLCMVARLHSPTNAADLLRAVGANLAVQAVICVGSDEPDEPLAAALLKLGRGDDVPAGPTGSLMNTLAAKLEPANLAGLRKRVHFIDLLGCKDSKKLLAQVEVASGGPPVNAGIITHEDESGLEHLVVPLDVRYEVHADKTGRFDIRLAEQSIIVEHRNARNEPLRIIEGKTARDICLTLIRNGWVSRLDHAAYLGRELARAELALRSGQVYAQDTAEPIRDTAQGPTER
ncbi:MAG TPA: DUF4346 domain-containing protein [Gammaproteobacteria bacterium]|jgi:tetrahydromethanopterin S-methyltransferase subunit A|nr:DUF4346 domain-containing protein [Gammaproteobacteria bacterium]